MNSDKNPNHGDIISVKNSQVSANVADDDNRAFARKRSCESDRGEGLLKKLKQAYDSSLKERSLTTTDIDSMASAQALPTVSDEEIAFSDLAILTSSGKVPVNLKGSGILDAGDDHSTVVDETWHLEELFGPFEGISDTAGDSSMDNLFGIPNDLFQFGLETHFPPPRNEKGEIVQFASVREALQSIGREQREASDTQSRSDTRQPALLLPKAEQACADVDNARSTPASSLQPAVFQGHPSRPSPAMSVVSTSSFRPALSQDHSPRHFRDGSSSRAMLPPPPVPVIAIQPRRQYGLPHSVPSYEQDYYEQRCVTAAPGIRPLHHPLSGPSLSYPAHHLSTRNDTLALPVPLVQNCDEPAVLTLTSFPFRIICVNKAFSDMTGRSHELIGYSFYELFVSESDHTPSMATTPTLLGLFNNDIVRVIVKGDSTRRSRATATTTNTASSRNPMDLWVESYDSDGSSSSSIGSIGVEDEVEDDLSSSDTFCMIRVEGIPSNGTNMQYFSIKLSPLQIPPSNRLGLTNNNNNNHHSFSRSSVIYLPMPCVGTGNGGGVPPLQPRPSC